MYEELIQALQLHCEAGKKIGLNGKIWTLLGDASTALETLTAQLSALQAENAEKDKEIERLTFMMDSAKNVATKRGRELARMEAERDTARRTLEGICGQIDNDCWLRKQFCENGNGDLEPCLCPSLREHSGYIDSDDCEGCEFFVNSWRGAQGEG